MSSNLQHFRVFQRLAAVFLLCLAVFGCEGKNVLTVLGPGGGGGTPDPGDTNALTVVNYTPGITEDASTTTHIIIQFDRAPDEASLTDRVELRFINEVNNTQNLVPLTLNTDPEFAGLDQSVVIYDLASPPLLAFTHTTNGDSLGRRQFYRLSILPGIKAEGDAGTLTTTVVHDFGTGAEDTVSNFPASIEVNGENPFPSMLPPTHFYSNESTLDVFISGSGDTNAPVLMILNADDGGAVPGDFAVRYTPGGGLSELIAIPDTPTPPDETEYDVTLTAYDASFNVASKTFTFTYDTLAPDAPTNLARSDGMSDPVTTDSIDVDVTFSAAPSPTGAYEVRVTGGLMPTPIEQVLANPQTDITVSLRQNQGNNLQAIAFDAAGNMSAPSAVLSVTHDDLAPTASVQWVPALALNTTNTIKQTTVKAQVSVTSMEMVTIEIHSDKAASNPIVSSVVTGPVTKVLDVDLAFVVPEDPPETDLRVYVSDGAGNMIEVGPYTVRLDLSVDPAPTITRLCDANGPCLPVGTAMGECAATGGMLPRSSSCVQYDLGAPGGYRTALSDIFAFGTVEAGSTLRFVPPGGLFVNGAADPTSDVFPADGTNGPTIRAVASGGRFDIAATDTSGNQITTISDAQLVTDRSAPDAPAFTGAASDGMTCMLSVNTSDPVFDVVLLLEGPFTGDCDALSMDFDLTDSTDNPDRSLGESLLARVTTDTTFESSAAAPAVPPMSISASVPGITLPASYENSISEFTATTVDAVGNESDPIRVAVIHRTDSETVIPASIEMLTNSGGDHNGEALSFSVTMGPPDIINTRPTNATSVVIDGRTDPSADDVELLDDTLQPFMTPVTDVPDASTGAFSLSTPGSAFSTDGTYTFYVRTTRTTMMGTQTEDVRVNIIYDTTGPTTTPSAQITAPQGGATAPVAIAVANLADTTGLNQVELVARRFSDIACTMAVALPMDEVCESTLTSN
ncbi:MAG: hypothetical protein KDH09_01900, partial [Chrysiogenetes bacterium]|nr:hypothetical protein [Chrysiogenetes bacterium]